MYMVRVKAANGNNLLINPKDIKSIRETKNNTALISFISGCEYSIQCNDFDELEQKILDASLPEIDLKSTDGLQLYVQTSQSDNCFGVNGMLDMECRRLKEKIEELETVLNGYIVDYGSNKLYEQYLKTYGKKTCIIQKRKK